MVKGNKPRPGKPQSQKKTNLRIKKSKAAGKTELASLARSAISFFWFIPTAHFITSNYEEPPWEITARHAVLSLCMGLIIVNVRDLDWYVHVCSVIVAHIFIMFDSQVSSWGDCLVIWNANMLMITNAIFILGTIITIISITTNQILSSLTSLPKTSSSPPSLSLSSSSPFAG